MYPFIAKNEETGAKTRKPDSEEDELVAAAKSGDSAAFDTLVKRNKGLVLAIARRMTGNSLEAEDVSQQTFMKAFAKLSSFGGRCSFSTWLVTIAMNEARMWHRRARRSREGLITDLCIGETTVEIPLEFMDRRPSPEATYLQKERRQLLRSAMERLKPETREALKACDLEEQSTIAAAVALGITVSAVKSRKLRGRLALRRTLESRLPPDGRRSPKSAQ